MKVISLLIIGLTLLLLTGCTIDIAVTENSFEILKKEYNKRPGNYEESETFLKYKYTIKIPGTMRNITIMTNEDFPEDANLMLTEGM